MNSIAQPLGFSCLFPSFVVSIFCFGMIRDCKAHDHIDIEELQRVR